MFEDSLGNLIPGVLGSTVSQWGVALLASVVNVTVV